MAKVTVLDLVVTGDGSDAAKAFDSVGTAAKGMGDDVKTASRDIDTSTSRIDSAADASDNLASKSSQATGGLGALAAGFSLVGAEKYAAGLEAAAMATDFFSGVGDISNLVLQSSVALKIKDAAASTVAAVKTGVLTVQTAAMTAVTKTAAAGQWLLNAALTANPIGIVVVALVALVAGLVLAYKKSDAFRAIVQKGFGVVVRVTDNVVDAVGDLVGWVKDKLPAAGRVAKTLVVTYFKAMVLGPYLLVKGIQVLYGWAKDKIPAAFQAARDRIATVVQTVREKIGTITDKARDVYTWVRSNLASGFTAAKDKIAAPITTITGWIDDLIDTVRDLIGWIGDIKFPDAPSWIKGIDVNPFSKAGSGPSMGGGNTYITINVDGALDPVAVAQQIKTLLQRQGLWNGTLVVNS